MAHLQVTTTFDSKDAAESVARTLVEERLAACVHILAPIRSTYWWNGGVEVADEWMCWAKTTGERYDSLAARIKELHPYETPEITATVIAEGDPDYLRWIDAETVSPR